MIHVYRFVFFILQLRNRVGGTYVLVHAVTTSDCVSLKPNRAKLVARTHSITKVDILTTELYKLHSSRSATLYIEGFHSASSQRRCADEAHLPVVVGK